MQNLLLKSDNIQGLEYLLKAKELEGKIDLIYIDPPFATGIDFTFSDEITTHCRKSSVKGLANEQ